MDARELELLQGDLQHRRIRAVQLAWVASVAAAIAIGSAWFWPKLAIALAAGSAVEAIMAAFVLQARSERIARLALEPDAYSIPEVGRYGNDCVRERVRLGSWLAEIAADARPPGSMYLTDHVAHFAQELETLAYDLASATARVHPVSAVVCRHLLTNAAESPLYNPQVPRDQLWDTMRRIRGGIQSD